LASSAPPAVGPLPRPARDRAGGQPLAELTTAIRDSGGYAEGVLQRVGLFGDTAEISVK
jgi:hypothetical protein